jgi:hypothetical protein
MNQSAATKPRRRSAINVAAACVVAVFAALNLSAYPGFWNSGVFGQFGFDTGQSNGPIGHGVISDVVPGSPAASAGLKPGDAIVRPVALRDRLLVIGELMPVPGERLTMLIMRGGRSRTVTIEARSPAPLSLSENVSDAFLVLALIMYLAVGFVLTLLRPGWMTWGFFLFAFGLLVGWSPCSCWGYPSQAISLSTYMSISEIQGPLVDFGIVGILVFCLRFPTDTPTGWRRAVGSAAVYLAIALTALDTAREWYLDGFRLDIADTLSHVFDVVSLGIVVASTAALLMTFRDGSELERHKIKWVVSGLVLAMIPAAATLLSWEGRFEVPVWVFGALNLLLIPLPITIAYAVIRHRVIDIRFVLSRSLVVGGIGAVVAVLIIATDWVFGSQLSASRYEATAYVALALLIGFSMSAAGRWLGRMTDALFFRQRDRTQKLAGVVSDAVTRAASPDALREPLTIDLANALALASAALFEHIESGGFVRTASSNWPDGTIWHILPDDAAAKRVAERGRVTDIDNIAWDEGAVPSGFGRPTILVPIIAGKVVAAILLLGSHENGTALDPDEVRMVRNIAADAGVVFKMARPGQPSYSGETPHPART